MEETVVIDVAGRVTIGHDAEMRDAINNALEAGARNIVMNMERVSKMDSSGIGELVAAHTSVKSNNGRFILVALSERLAAVLQITQVLGVLESFDDMETALDSLGTASDG
ncbi:MAG: STAS domain-containing protein [Thermoanaerobaculia bacterium]